MKKITRYIIVLAAMSVAGLGYGAPNFVDNNTALPGVKTDRFPPNNPSQQWTASDANTVVGALADLRTVAQRSQITAQAFGATGNNTCTATPCQDWTAITAAMAAAAATVNGQPGGMVILPKGTYVIDQPLVIPAGVGLRGDNTPATMIKLKSGATVTAMIRNTNQTGGLEFAYLESLTVEAAGGTCTEAAVSWGSLFVNSYIRDVEIEDSSTVGLRVFAGGSPGGAAPVQIENTWVVRSGTDNVLIEDATTNNGAIAGLTFINLTSEHQGQNSSAIRILGRTRGGQMNFYNTHIEMDGTHTGVTGITIDGWPDIVFSGVQILTGNNASVTAGITITSDAKNVREQFRGIYNPNLINPVLNDVKNSATFGATAVPYYGTPEVTFSGQRFVPSSAGISAAFQNNSGTDKAWFNTNGAITGASVLGGAGIDIIADATNNRAWCTGNNASARFFCLYYPDSSFIRFRALSAGFDVWDADNSGNFRTWNNTSLGVNGGTTTIANNATFQAKILSTGTVPTLTSCGTSPTVDTGSTSDWGEFTTGSAATTCTVTFASAWPAKPHCIVQGNGVVNPTYSTSTTAITMTVDVASTTYRYNCGGH